jgi:hypothetical protein
VTRDVVTKPTPTLTLPLKGRELQAQRACKTLLPSPGGRLGWGGFKKEKEVTEGNIGFPLFVYRPLGPDGTLQGEGWDGGGF